MYNIPNEVQIGTLRVSLLCEHWCSVLPTDSTGAFFWLHLYFNRTFVA